MSFFQHPQSLVESSNVGRGTRIWAFAHVLPGAVIGEDCNICDHTFVENDVRLGNRVTIKSGVQLWDGVTLEDDVFVGPNVTFTNDPFPRNKQHPPEFARTIVRKGASIGANATLLPGLTIGAHAMVGAGAVVTRSVPPYAIVVGNPARIVGYTPHESPVEQETSPVTHKGGELTVPGVSLRQLPIVDDLRGSLSFGQYDRHLPFIPKRYFIVFDVPGKEVRGEHAHKQLHQFLVCVKGSCSVVVDDGQRRQELLLDTPGLGLHIPPMVWATEYKYTSDAVLLVLASDVYDPDDYIRSYDEFLALKRMT
jgi:UDP-2-acetamido-3-amino-2,3-dideoxy-glucuronate N-acetyltransferase